MHFMKPVWHSLTANLLPLAVPFFLFLFLTFVFNHHLFSLTSLFPLFTSPSPVLFLATISFPLLSSPSFLCSALLLIFCPIHEVLLPEGVFKLHPAKKKKKAPQNPSSSQSQLTECYFLRLCLHDSVGGYLLLFFLFFFFSWFGESWAIFAHCGTCMFTLSLPKVFVYLDQSKVTFVCAISYPCCSPPPLYPPPPSFWPISIVAPPHWQPCISSSLPYVKVSG